MLLKFALILCLFSFAFGQSEYCFKCQQRRNQKDMYPDPNGDCHSFYKCLYVNETYAIGTKMACPRGTYWHDEILQCLPEGSTPCTDVCQNPQVAVKGCYASPDGNCATYFVCSGTASYAMCCAPSTGFNPVTCNCDSTEPCFDNCILPTVPPTTEKPAINFGTYCIDSFGNRLQPADSDNHFLLVADPNDPAQIHKFPCPGGTTFNMDSCRCEGWNVIPITEPQNRQCSLYLPFDEDVNDYSINKFFTELIQPGNINQQTFARGYGSLLVYGGYLEIPGFRNFDFYNTASLCLFFRCRNPPCQGGLVTNCMDMEMTDYTLMETAQSGDEVLFQGMYMDKTTNQAQLPIDTSLNTPSGFTQTCFVFDKPSNTISVYINNVLVFSIPAAARPNIGQCPMAVGACQQWGNYDGYLDEVLVCREALTVGEVNAHWNGRMAMEQAGLIPPAFVRDPIH